MSDESFNPATINFTPRAQQVLHLARKEAERFQHNFVGTEHVLLGLIRLGQGTAVNVLHKMGVDLDAVRLEVEKHVGTGPEKVPGHIPYTPRVKRVLSLAAKEAQALHHTYVGTEHLLLGLMQDPDGVAGRILVSLKVDLDRTRVEILRELDPNSWAEPSSSSPHKIPIGQSPSPFSRFEQLQTESILPGLTIEIEPATALLIAPATPEFKPVIETALKPAFDANGLNVQRAEDVYKDGVSLKPLWEKLRKTEVIVVDCSGRNPNVMFVMGLCYGLHRYPILLVQNPSELPSTLRNLQYLQYDPGAPEGLEKLKKALTARILDLLLAVRS